MVTNVVDPKRAERLAAALDMKLHKDPITFRRNRRHHRDLILPQLRFNSSHCCSGS